jgi:hypothetical protein
MWLIEKKSYIIVVSDSAIAVNLAKVALFFLKTM